MVFQDESGQWRNAAGWEVSAPDDEPHEAESERTRDIANDRDDNDFGSPDEGSSGSDDGDDDKKKRSAPDPTSEDSPGGTTVGSSELENYVASGGSLNDVGGDGALNEQVERLTGVDAREVQRENDMVESVGIDDGRVFATVMAPRPSPRAPEGGDARLFTASRNATAPEGGDARLFAEARDELRGFGAGYTAGGDYGTGVYERADPFEAPSYGSVTRDRTTAPPTNLSGYELPDAVDRLSMLDEAYARADRAVAGDDLPGLADTAAGSLDEWVGRNTDWEADPEVQSRLTEGRGLFSEADEREVRRDIEARSTWLDYQDELRDAALFVTGDERAGEAAYGVGSFIADAPGTTGYLTLAADTASEAAVNAPGAVSELGAGRVGATVAETVLISPTESALDSVQENPYRAAGEVTASVATGVAAGKALGSVARRTADRTRTVGGQELELRDLAQEDVVRYVETGGAEGDSFPGAYNPELYRSDPSAAVVNQASVYTPDAVRDRFMDAGVVGDAPLKKAFGVEPDSPGRGVGGMTSAPDETGATPDTVTAGTVRQNKPLGDQNLEDIGGFRYETPGSFFGPELSPYFLGDTSVRYSLRPGLPSTGDRPTAVIASAPVRNTPESDLVSFGKRQTERDGATFETKPPQGEQFNTGEIEAVAPPGATFSDVGGSRTRAALRRLGVGSDFYVSVPRRRSVDLPGGRKEVPDRVERTLSVGNRELTVGFDVPDRLAGRGVDLPGGRTVDLPAGERRVPVRLAVGDYDGDLPRRSVDDALRRLDEGDASLVFRGEDADDLRRRYEGDGTPDVDRPLPVAGYSASRGRSDDGGGAGGGYGGTSGGPRRDDPDRDLVTPPGGSSPGPYDPDRDFAPPGGGSSSGGGGDYDLGVPPYDGGGSSGGGSPGDPPSPGSPGVPFAPPDGPPSTPVRRREGRDDEKKPGPDVGFDFGGDADVGDEVAVGYLAETLGEFGGVSASDVDLRRSDIEASEAAGFSGEAVTGGEFEAGVTTGIDTLFGSGTAEGLGFGEGHGGDFAEGKGGEFSWTDEL